MGSNKSVLAKTSRFYSWFSSLSREQNRQKSEKSVQSGPDPSSWSEFPSIDGSKIDLGWSLVRDIVRNTQTLDQEIQLNAL